MAQRYPLAEALRAQAALRNAAGLPPEEFPVDSFIGMISDEIEALRKRGFTDERIAEIIHANSSIQVTARDIDENCASPEARHQR